MILKFLLVVFVFFVVERILAHYMTRWAREDLQAFEKRFPGKCPICAFHRHGLQEGYAKPGSVVPYHEGCPEETADMVRATQSENGDTANG